MKSRQSGFTLVEIAIVLVIIGLLLGGVLKGQEMIENAKIKSVINDLKGVSAAYYAYQDRYKAIPGDDVAASTRLVGAKNGNGDGAITGLFNAMAAPADATTESNNFWQHTRMAGFMTGVATAVAAPPPLNSVGGVLGVQGATTFAMIGTVVCASNVPFKIAQSVDVQLDDGDSATGSVRSGAAATTATATTASSVYGPAVTPTTTDTTHTVCMKI